ncbi:MAG: osmoprotectant transport system ATP-binding protein [Rhodothermales bacterium]|jgi:osmoprotectant transport system ATP-binding protein
MFTLEHVSKRYGQTTAVARLSHAFKTGETTALIGPSGCGKSTLLRLCLGLVQTDSGRVLFGDSILAPKTVTAIRHRVGYVIQDGGLFPHLTVYQNAALLPGRLGWKKDRTRARAESLASLVRLDPTHLSRYPLELSGGQRQRVGLIRALMTDPDVLLLDEPLGALDPMIRAELQSQLVEMFRSLGKTVILVTHDIGEAGLFAHHILLMKAGGIVQKGSLKDLVRTPVDAFVREFINAQRSPLESLREVHP